MKKASIILAVLTTFLFVAQDTAPRWGIKLFFGTEFAAVGNAAATDSLFLKGSAIRDTLLADTMYSGVIRIGSEDVEGVFTVNAYFDELSSEAGTLDSINVDIRRVINYGKVFLEREHGIDGNVPASVSSNHHRFDVWKKLLKNVSAGVMNSITLTEADSVWWKQCSGYQLRVYALDASADSAIVDIVDYLD